MASVDQFEILRPKIVEKLRAFPDFPKPGILFRDIMPLFAEPVLVNDLCRAIAEHAKKAAVPVQAVAGLEARGFLFGPQIAFYLNVPFVPIRKKGKLPGKTVTASYVKEYGEDVVEVQEDALPNGTNVFIIDDLLATGGTLRAAIELLTKAKCNIVEAMCLIELDDLKGRAVLPSDTKFTSLVHF